MGSEDEEEEVRSYRITLMKKEDILIWKKKQQIARCRKLALE